MYKRWHRFKKHHRLTLSLIILSGIIFFWRGLWGLLETYLYPENPQISFFISLSLGIIILAITHYSIEKVA
ncbi:MAG: hypothetical protein KAK00_06100 [Nanoarchaeota archaeon]|nr:hypothetical protein [Nanoarchaeota archaeon]